MVGREGLCFGLVDVFMFFLVFFSFFCMPVEERVEATKRFSGFASEGWMWCDLRQGERLECVKNSPVILAQHGLANESAIHRTSICRDLSFSKRLVLHVIPPSSESQHYVLRFRHLALLTLLLLKCLVLRPGGIAGYVESGIRFKTPSTFLSLGSCEDFFQEHHLTRPLLIGRMSGNPEVWLNKLIDHKS